MYTLKSMLGKIAKTSLRKQKEVLPPLTYELEHVYVYVNVKRGCWATKNAEKEKK